MTDAKTSDLDPKEVDSHDVDSNDVDSNDVDSNDVGSNDVGSNDVGPDPSERRSAQRVAVEMFVREHDGERTWVHPATNLSATGLFIESHSYSHRSAIDRQHMELEFELPESPSPIVVHGEVVAMRRVNGYAHGLAVEFVDLPTAHHDAIAAFVAQRLAQGDDVGPSDEAAPTSD